MPKPDNIPKYLHFKQSNSVIFFFFFQDLNTNGSECKPALRDVLSDKRYIKIMCYVMLKGL